MEKLKTENKEQILNRLKIFLPLMAMSIFILIAVFPGHYPYDAASMYRNYSTGNYSTHFTPLICFLLGKFMDFGKALGSVNLGHTLFVFLQSILVNVALTETILYCSEKLKNKKYKILMILFFVFHPLVQILMIRSGQDTIFAGLFLLIALELLKISENENYFEGGGITQIC